MNETEPTLGPQAGGFGLDGRADGFRRARPGRGDYWDVDRLDWYYDRWIDNGAEAWYREATAYALDNSLILPFGRSFEGGEVLNRGQFVAILQPPGGH